MPKKPEVGTVDAWGTPEAIQAGVVCESQHPRKLLL
jgi:hypothetical protein